LCAFPVPGYAATNIDKISIIFAFALAFYAKVWYNIGVDRIRHQTQNKEIEK
jgi:hypothetical protein